MSDFWNSKQLPPKPWEQPVIETPMPVLDEEVVADLQREDYNIFDDEEDDVSEIMHDANLRLEMGRLYQMILQGDLFADTNADPKAIKKVQREIRKLVREKMEVMLGIRQEQPESKTVVSSPFNDLEVTALKMIASKVTKGASETPVQIATQPTIPKKDGITPISGTLRPNAPILNKSKAKPQIQTPKAAPKSAISNITESALTKPVSEMTQEELIQHNNQAELRNAQKKAQSQNIVPHPSQDQVNAMYAAAAVNGSISLSANRVRPFE